MKTNKITRLSLGLILALSLCLGFAPAAAAEAEAVPQQSVTALHSDVTLMLYDQTIQLEAYNIGGSNYFRLRDLAYL
jgi:hypothetical protein